MKYLFLFIFFISNFSFGQFDDARDFSNGLAAVKTAELWGFIDIKGKMVIEPKYLEVSDFTEGTARVKIAINNWTTINHKSRKFSIKNHNYKKKKIKYLKNEILYEKIFFVNNKGKILKTDFDFVVSFSPININNDFRDDFEDGLIIQRYVSNDSRGKAFYDTNFNFVFKIISRKVKEIKNNRILFKSQDYKKNYPWGYANNKGEIVIEPKYDRAFSFHENKAVVFERKKLKDSFYLEMSIIDTLGNVISKIPNSYLPAFIGQHYWYDDGYQFGNGLLPIIIDNKINYINENGKVILSTNWKYNYLKKLNNQRLSCCFYNGLALVANEKGKCGFINAKGELAIDTMINQAGDHRYVKTSINYSADTTSKKKGYKPRYPGHFGRYVSYNYVLNGITIDRYNDEIRYITNEKGEPFRKRFAYELMEGAK